MSKPDIDAVAKAIAERDQARNERDAAIAELNFALAFLEDLGVSLRKGRLTGFHPSGAGVEVCTVYPTDADAAAAEAHIYGLSAMIALTGGEGHRRSVH